MRNRKVVAFILTLSLVFSSFSVSFATTESSAASTNSVTFSDVSDHWGAAAISKWSGYGIINGYEGLFRPDDPITRGEMAVILDNMMDYQEVAANTFTDLQAGQFYTDAVLKANAAGIVKGDGVTVRPTDEITKEEAAIMMSRAFAVTEASSTKAFLDASAVSDWAKGAVFGMEAKGYVSGFGGYFNPRANITRSEAVTMINNIVKAYYTTAGTYTDDVAGTAVIKVPDVILKGVSVSENLIIAEGVGNGDATLDSVTVKGETVIRGGGENSVHITGNSVITRVTIEKVGDKLRVVIDDGITVRDVEVAIGEEIIITGSVGTIELNAPNATVYANAAVINTATIAGNNSTIVVGAQSTVNNVTVSSSADNTSIRTETGAVVGTITASSEVQVSGTGTVTKVTLQAGADGSSVTTPNTATTVPAGVTGVTGGGGTSIPAGSTGTNSTTGTTATVTTTTTTSSSSGSSSSSTVAVTGVTVTSTAVTISSNNGTLQMTALVEPSNATNNTVTWSVTNGTGYATINSSGLLTAVSDGTVTVTAVSVSNGTVSGSMGITLSNQSLESITTAGATRTAPSVGEPGAAASVSATANYTHVSTVWSGKAGTNYAVGETPAAIITLEAKTDYTFTGIAAGSVTVAGGTVSFGGGGPVSGGAFLVFTVTYPQLTETLASATATCTSPAIGEAGSSAAVAGAANYTHTSTVWSGRAGGTFAAGETPAAIITLTAKTGYSFSAGMLPGSITVAGGTVSYEGGQGVAAGGGSVTFTVTYAQLIGTLASATVVVTAPVLGETPLNTGAVEAATSDANFTVSNVTWNGTLASTGKFRADTAYSASIVLTSKNGYAFQAGAFTPTVGTALSVGTTSTVGTGIGNTASFTASFTTTGALTVSSISVSNQPGQLTYFEGATLSLNGLVVTATNNDTTTAQAVFGQPEFGDYTAAPANGTTLTTAYNGTPVAITHIATGKTTTTNALSVGSTVSAISGADVSLTSGSIVFDYDFTGTSGAIITYAQGQLAPYYLDIAASTVTLTDGTSSTSAVSLNALGISDDGVVSYSAISSIGAVFSGLDFIPSQVVINLIGATSVNGGTNQWTYNTSVILSGTEIGLLTPDVIDYVTLICTSPAIGETGATVTTAGAVNFTITSVGWYPGSGGGGAYAPGNTPAAIIALTANPDYIFTGLTENHITITGGSVTYEGASQGVTAGGFGVIFTVFYPQLVGTITSASVTVAAPVLGETPQNTGDVQTATSNAAFTVSNVAWNEDLTSAGKFKAGQSYSASFVLTAMNGYTFDGSGVTAAVPGSESVGAATVSGTGIGNSVSFTASFATTGALTVSAITVTSQPSKMSYMESSDDTLALNGMEILETYNDGTTDSAIFTDGTFAGYSANPANGATLTPAYNGTPVAITHDATGEMTTTTALTVLSTVSAISGADVELTSGSIIFSYAFNGTGGAITYADALAGPYYLDVNLSTVTLKNSTLSSNAVSVSALGLAADGSVSYATISDVQTAFPGMTFIPTQVAIHLTGATAVNNAANPWTFNINVDLDETEIGLLAPDVITSVAITCASPAIGENGASAVPGSANFSVDSTTWIGQFAGPGTPFVAGDTPSAIITITAATDYIFTGLTAGGITVAGGTVSFEGVDGVTAGGMAVTFKVTYPQLIGSITTAGAVCASPSIGDAAAAATPDATVDAGANYTYNNITWSGFGGVNWTGGETPAAIIVLSAKANYAFDDNLDATDITVAGGTVSFESGDGVTGSGMVLQFTVTYPQLPVPEFVSAATNATGDAITITFSKAMADPSGKHAEFSFNDGFARTFSAAALNADPTKIDLTVFGPAIANDATVTVSYTVGTVTASDGSVLATFVDQPVTNIVPPADLTGVMYDNGIQLIETDDTLTLTFSQDIASIGAAGDYEVKFSDTGVFGGEEITFTPGADYTISDGAGNTVVITFTSAGWNQFYGPAYFRVTVLNTTSLSPDVNNASKTVTIGPVDPDEADM